MALRKSTGLVDFIAGSGSARQALSNGRSFIYSGTQPATADDAVTGTLLVTLTKGSGTFTAETLPVWQFTLTGTSGSLTSVKVGSVECLSTSVAFTTDLTTTATAVAANITANFSLPDFTATSSGAVVSVIGPFGCGATLNDMTIATIVSGGDLDATVASSGNPTTSGVTAVNGCNWQFPASVGALSKETTAWSGVAVATGTAGWFRYKADSADTDGSSTTFKRMDGAIATSGAELNLSSTSITSGATISVSTATFTVSK